MRLAQNKSSVYSSGNSNLPLHVTYFGLIECKHSQDYTTLLLTVIVCFEYILLQLKDRVRQLEWQLETADADRKALARKLIALKRDNQRLRVRLGEVTGN